VDVAAFEEIRAEPNKKFHVVAIVEDERGVFMY